MNSVKELIKNIFAIIAMPFIALWIIICSLVAMFVFMVIAIFRYLFVFSYLVLLCLSLVVVGSLIGGIIKLVVCCISKV